MNTNHQQAHTRTPPQTHFVERRSSARTHARLSLTPRALVSPTTAQQSTVSRVCSSPDVERASTPGATSGTTLMNASAPTALAAAPRTSITARCACAATCAKYWGGGASARASTHCRVGRRILLVASVRVRVAALPAAVLGLPLCVDRGLRRAAPPRRANGPRARVRRPLASHGAAHAPHERLPDAQQPRNDRRRRGQRVRAQARK